MIPKCLGSIEDDNGNGWSEGEREELSGWFAFRHDLTIKGQVNLWEVLFLPSFFIILFFLSLRISCLYFLPEGLCQVMDITLKVYKEHEKERNYSGKYYHYFLNYGNLYRIIGTLKQKFTALSPKHLRPCLYHISNHLRNAGVSSKKRAAIKLRFL